MSHDTKLCIVTEAASLAGRAGRRTEARSESGSRRTDARSESSSRRTGTRHKRLVRGLGVLLGYGLCTQCTRPVFDPV